MDPGDWVQKVLPILVVLIIVFVIGHYTNKELKKTHNDSTKGGENEDR